MNVVELAAAPITAALFQCTLLKEIFGF